ncbi:TniB family NTP-binding protein [Pseudomonas sp. PDM07]|uniref:TniB family NTP-binding protein n=1 Tax=Pseudomonas sp. PDM07 TaxID=2769264 RepID=UPI00177E1023|nr:TniB family NTP-binding protein [Pseudomonas sp. PDM07]MBD9618202.1 TniB family NTP-binding protein [Pseudomonas sp. PDM07]
MIELTPETLALLHLPAEERALACMREIWIDYPAATRAMDLAMELVKLPRRTYNPGMLITGTIGAGKSTMVQRWADQSWEPNSAWKRKIVYVDMSENTNELNVQKRVIEEIGIRSDRPYIRTATEAWRAIKDFNIGALVVDEFGETEETSIARIWKRNLLSARGLAGRRWLVNLILVGTDAFSDTVMGNEHLRSRFANRRQTMKSWLFNADLAGFIAAYESCMPMKQYSAVTTDSFLSTLLQHSLAPPEGSDAAVASLRLIIDLFAEAHRYALLHGQEYVDENTLRDAHSYMSNSKPTVEWGSLKVLVDSE